MFVASSLLAVVEAQTYQNGTTTDRKLCKATCSRGCKKVKKSKPARFTCTSCKRGFARNPVSAEACNVCAPNYGTVIDPSLPASVRRGFVACKRTPCNVCTACPQGTGSLGGNRVPESQMFAAGAAMCRSAGQSTFSITINTNPAAGGLTCEQAYAQVLQQLLATSIQNQGGQGVVVTPNPANCNVTDVGGGAIAASYTFDVTYTGNPGIGANIQNSLSQSCSVTSPTDQTGGICSATPNANAQGQNLCTGLTSTATPVNSAYVMCAGQGSQDWTQTVTTTPITLAVPLECNTTFMGILATLMEASLESRPDVVTATITPQNCSVIEVPAGSQQYLAIYPMDIQLLGSTTVEATVDGIANATPINSQTFTGGVCDAYPKALGSLNLCEAFVQESPPGFLITASAAAPNNTVPTATIAQGVTTAQVNPECDPVVGQEIAAQQTISLQANSLLSDESKSTYINCNALEIPASAYVVLNNVLYVSYNGVKYQGQVSPQFAASFAQGTLDVGSAFGRRLLEAPGAVGESSAGRHLLQSGVSDDAGDPKQNPLFLMIYNTVLQIIALLTENQTVSQAQITELATNITTLSQQPGGLDQAFPLPGGASFTVTVTDQVTDKTNTGVALLVSVAFFNLTGPQANISDTTWAALQQTFVTTAYGFNDQPIGCQLPTDTPKGNTFAQFIATGVKDSLIAQLGAASTPTAPFISCVDSSDTQPPYANYTMQVAFQGTRTQVNAILNKSVEAPFSVCQAYKAMPSASPPAEGVCESFSRKTQESGVSPAQQILCIQAGPCPGNCPPGTWYGYPTTPPDPLPSCKYALGGWYSNSSNPDAMIKCPVDTASTSVPERNILNGGASLPTCISCPTGASTNGQTGQLKCRFIKPGYYAGPAPSYTPIACPPDTFSNTTRQNTNAPSCEACPAGTGTFNSSAQVACQPVIVPTTSVAPGNYWDPVALESKPCPTGSFNPNTRVIASDPAGAATCYSCSMLVSFRDLNPQAGIVYELESTGNGGILPTSCSCPANTFLRFDAVAGGGSNNFVCAACPRGTTSGSAGATDQNQCYANCRQGYWGTPSSQAYGGCIVCPTISPGNAPGSTTGNLATTGTPAGVPHTACTTCSAGSNQTSATSTIPQTCSACLGPNEASSNGVDCDSCLIGFWGASCTACPTKYPAKPVKTSMPLKTNLDEANACGPGCAAGWYGATCDTACNPDANINAALKSPKGTAAKNVTGAAWVSQSGPTNGPDNCVWGCPAGWGYDYASDSCVACSGQFSAGATPFDGTNFFAAWPVCQNCPTDTSATDGNTRCVTTMGKMKPAAEGGLFDEFD